MSINTNASAAKNGFNYQDVVAVALLIKNIKTISYMVDEGKNGDIELKFNDNKNIYLQCKLRMNTLNTDYTVSLKKALRDLINSYNKDTKPDKIIYVTNSNYPFGKNKNFDFTTQYKMYNYKHFDKDIKGKISTQIGNIKNDFNNNKDKNLSAYTNNLSTDKLDQILNNLSVMKFAFDGEDNDSKLQLAYQYLEQFLTNLKIYGSVDTRTVFNNLYTRINIGTGMDKGNKRKIIKKGSILAELLVSFLRSNNSLYDNFASHCQIDFGEDEYIKNEVNELKDLFINDFDLQSKIYADYKNYVLEHKNISDRWDKLGSFINQNISQLSKQFKMTDKQDVVKYMVWIMICKRRNIAAIKEECNYEN